MGDVISGSGLAQTLTGILADWPQALAAIVWLPGVVQNTSISLLPSPFLITPAVAGMICQA